MVALLQQNVALNQIETFLLNLRGQRIVKCGKTLSIVNGARYTRARIQFNVDPKWTCQVQIVFGFA